MAMQDKRMMKKITVVAQLDKAVGHRTERPPWPGAQTSSGHAGPSKTMHRRWSMGSFKRPFIAR